MALFQQEKVNNIQLEDTPQIQDSFSKVGFDDVLKEREQRMLQRRENESLYVKNIVSPEKIKEWQDKGAMSALEVWSRKNKNELLPYMGTIKQGSKSFEIKRISDKLRNGEVTTPEEREKFNNFVLDMAEIQTRGYSFGGGVVNIGLETLPFMVEFGIGLLTTGGGASFASSVAKGGIKATAKNVGANVAKEIAQQGLGKTILNGAGQTVYNAALNPATYKFAATRLPQQVYARMGDIELSDSMYVTPEGQAILKEAEAHPAIAFMKALALTNIETASEMSGEILVRPIMQGLGRIAAPKVLREMASKTFPEQFVKLAEKVTNMPFARAVDKLGWNGILEEMGEERIGDLLQFAFNLDDKEGYSFEQLLDAAFPSREQLGQEALAFALTGAGMNAMHGALNHIPKYNKDGFLLDAGIFRVAGYDSLIDKRVRAILQKQGKNEEEIENAVQFSTREDKVEFLKQNNMNLDDDIKEIQEDFKQTLLADGVSESRADFASRIYANLQATRADRTERSLEDLHAENTLKILENNEDFEINQEGAPVLRGGVEYNQSAFNKGNGDTYFQGDNSYNSFKEIEDEFKEHIEVAPDDYEINNLEDALKDLGITEKTPLVVNTPTGAVSVRVSSIEHIINGGDNTLHKPDKSRYKAINRMFAVLEKPEIITMDENGKKKYIKLFKGNGKAKSQIAVVYNDANGDYVYTTIPVTRHKNYILKEINSGKVIYKKGQTRENISAANNILPQNNENINSKTFFQTAYTGSAAKYDVPSLDFIGTGEGQQSHGWGLYYAKGKNVAEGYRKNLSDTDGIGTEIKVDNKTYKKVAFNTYRNKDDLYESVDDYLREALNFIETKGSKKEALKYIQNQIDNNKNAGYFDEAAYYIRIKNALNEIKQAKITKYADDYGQLFKVDVPEDDVLLDEDELLSEQNENVQKIVNKILDENDWLKDEFKNFDPSGKDLYKTLVKEFTLGQESKNQQLRNFGMEEDWQDPQKLASEFLNKYGIKGITYNGRQDGRCYVVFDDKAVKVLETYYQEENIKQPQEYDYIHNQETGEKIDIVMNEDIKVKEIEPQKISLKLPFEISKKPSENKKALIRILNLGNNKTISVKNNNTGENAIINDKTIEKSLSNTSVNNKNYKDFCTILNNIETLFENSQKILSYNDAKKDTDLMISRYANVAKIGNNSYLLEFILKDNGEISVYAVNTIDNKKQYQENASRNNSMHHDTVINSIANIQSVFKSKIVQKYNNDYKNSSNDTILLQDNINQKSSFFDSDIEKKLTNLWEEYSNLEDDIQNKKAKDNIKDNIEILQGYLEEGEGADLVDKIMSQDGRFTKRVKNKEPEQQNVFPGNNQARKIHKIKGAYIPAEKIIEFFKNADESTIVHEFGHWYLDNLIEDAKFHEASALDLAEVRKFVHNDGGEFTREQHEKFARGFEAYIRSGRARTNRLKKVFEDFKNALLAIYDTITQIVYTENGIEKPFSEEDMPQINALFERILSTENERVQASVFDKVNEIDDKIKSIKENEQKEFDELDLIYKDNIELLNRESDKKRQIEEYLELAEKQGNREPKELREWKKRYKEATVQILSEATGYDKKFIANPRNLEKVEFALDKVEDKIVLSGFNPEWVEFYSNEGFEGEKEELNASYNLARRAFEVLADNRYDKVQEDSYGFEEIEKFTGQFDYLISKIKSLKGEEQETAFEALSKLTLQKAPSMPDEVYREFLERLVDAGGKMENSQKEDFNRRHYMSIPVIEQLQFYVTQKLDNLKIYNPNLRYKTRLDRSHGLFKQIRNAKSVNDTKRIVKKINNLVIEDLKNTQRSMLHKEIQKQIKINSKHVKVGSIRRGKFDWRTNTIFAQLTKMNKMSQEEAQNKMSELLRLNEIENGEERVNWKDESADLSESMKSDFQDNLVRKFLQYRSQRLKELDVQHTSSLLEDILKLKFEGRRAKTEEDFKKNTQKFDYRNNLIEILDNNRDNKFAGGLANLVVKSGTLGNWETLLNTVFNDKTAKKYSLQNLEAQTQVFARKKTLELINRANEIYGFKNNNWDKALDYDGAQKFIKLMQEYSEETFDYQETTWNKETESATKTGVKLSRAQIMTIYTWSLNEALLQRLNNQYGIKQLDDMFSRLSKEDKQMCYEFVNICESMYEQINDVYINSYGLSLPKVENYFPSVTERVGSDLDMFHDFVVKSSNPSMIKQRKVCSRIPMKPKGPLEILLPHINKSANYITMSETVNFYNKIFKETSLNKKIVEVFGKKDGEKIVRAIQNQLSASTFTTVARGINFAHEFADNLATNFISSSIAASPKVMISQLLSCINYAENMPSHLWMKGFAQAIAHPRETFKYMMKCEYLQSRLAGNTQNEMMSTLTSEVDRFRTIKNFCSLTTKWGDIMAIVYGGKPYVDYLISRGMPEEKAFEKFVDDTLRAQQAGLPSTTSEWQKAQTKTAMGRAVFAFNNTNLQYERKFIDALSKLSKGDITKAQFAKSFMIYKVLNPIMFTSLLGNLSVLELSRALLGGDDEPENAFLKFGGDILLAVLLGSLGAYGIAGLIAMSLIRYSAAIVDKKIFEGKPYVFKSSLPILDVIDDVGVKFLKKDTSFADVVDVLGEVGDIGSGLPVSRIINALGGIGEISQGEYGIGVTRMLGWGEYKATEAWTGQSPKEKEKNKKRRK